jgi:hypothetical protein
MRVYFIFQFYYSLSPWLPLGRVGPQGRRGEFPSPDAFASDPPAMRAMREGEVLDAVSTYIII